jgi:EAL domain-containing protein (putative c-di-GMP-specific phosphodiesterase class I)
LKKLPFDKIKIDKDFIRDIFKSEEDSTIVNAIIQLGKTMSLGVIAEGVETQEQEIYLKSHGCLEGQGYFYSKPVPAEKFAEFVRNHNKRSA